MKTFFSIFFLLISFSMSHAWTDSTGVGPIGPGFGIVATPGGGVTLKRAWTTPGTHSWTIPAGVTSLHVEVVGGGGGGGGAKDGVGGGGAGGAGGFSKAKLDVTPGTTYSITVGAGGTRGRTGGLASTAGGASSFSGPGGTITAGGGAGGGRNPGTGGAGGAGSTMNGPAGGSGYKGTYDNRGLCGYGGDLSAADPAYIITSGAGVPGVASVEGVYTLVISGGGAGGKHVANPMVCPTYTDGDNGIQGAVLVAWTE